jgi:hypothetical protein
VTVELKARCSGDGDGGSDVASPRRRALLPWHAVAAEVALIWAGGSRFRRRDFGLSGVAPDGQLGSGGGGAGPILI